VKGRERRAGPGRWAAVASLFFTLVACGSGDAAPPPIRVAAASDLSRAFEELGGHFERQTGQRVVFTFGSTGLLSQQLRAGAPFDLFAAAQASYADDVIAAGACDGATKAPYARGRIVVWTKRGGVRPPRSLAELADARFKHVALASPEHAPYGRAAKEALMRAGVFVALEGRLVLGENVRHALQQAESGNAEAAIVALSLVALDRDNPWLLVDEAEHAPLEQALVVCTRGARRDGGEAFARFVSSSEGREVLRRHGLLLPGERPAGAP
jgi:molybdate transport system substrate-binding protein